MNKFGRKLTDEEIDEIMRQHDHNNDGYIDYEEFGQIFNIK